MTIKVYHIESAYNRYTGKTVEEDIGAYEKFVDKFIDAMHLKICKEPLHPLLWIFMDSESVYATWRYYKVDYYMSDDEYETSLEEYEAEECDVPRYIYEPSFIGELK